MRRRAALAMLGTALFASVGMVASPANAQQVVVHGSRRIDPETIKSYFGNGDQARINEGVKQLYATGQFSDVRVARQGGRIIVTVVENNSINRVAFEGNSKIKGAQLSNEVQSKTRGAYNPATVEADIQRIRDLYRRAGRGDARVTARTVPLPNGRMDVVFTIDEGGKTGVRTINFVGNQVYSNYRLRSLIETTEMNFLSWFKESDVYDPDKIAADLERIRRFYLKNGYADFRIVGSDAVYDEAAKGWVVTITMDEGAQYRVGNVRVDSRLPDVSPEQLQGVVKLGPGDIYNGDLVEKSVQQLTREVARKGYAFASARPQGDRNPGTRTVDLSFVMEEGPRVYVEKIIIRGNTRTREYVIRREFDLGEGDAYNRVLVDLAEKRLNNLGFFKAVKIINQPGSAPDRVIIIVDVEDKPTGSFGISGGYSTQDGLIAEVSVAEANFMGRGQYVRVSATVGQRARGAELSFTEPYFLGYRMSAGFDLFHRQTRNSRFSLYESSTTGATIRFGLPITDEFSVGMRYSLYNSRITIPNDVRRPYNDCTDPIVGLTPGTLGSPYPDPTLPGSTVTCMNNGEASLAIKQAAGQGFRVTSAIGYSLVYTTLDNMKNPTQGLYAEFRQDIAGLGGTARWVKTAGDLRYYYPVWDDVVGFARLQGGNITAFGGHQLRILDNFNNGANIVRGFAPNGLGPRDVSLGIDPRSNGLGGTTYYGGTLELQFPIFGMPKEVGLKGALFADAGTVFGYKGATNFSQFVGLPANSPCAVPLQNAGGYYYTQGNCITVRDTHKIRSSVGVSLLWASPLGPIRFDYAWVMSKDRYDVKQAFRFSGGTSF